MTPPFLNRNAYVVKPRRKFTEWLKYVDDTTCDRLVESLLGDSGNIYLFDELDTGQPEEAARKMKAHWRDIADAEFEAWWTMESDWPVLKGVGDFEKYFDWQHVETVNDLGTEPLELD